MNKKTPPPQPPPPTLELCSCFQRYVYEADEDKQRYIRELQAYQSSEAYRAFLRRRAAHKVQALCGEWALARGRGGGVGGCLQLPPPRPGAVVCFIADGVFRKPSALVPAAISIHILVYFGCYLLVRYTVARSLLSFQRLPFHLADCLLNCAFQFDGLPLVYFHFCCCAFGITTKKNHC